MAVSRVKADTVPAELQRQAGRVREQVVQLDNILGVITSDLSEMQTLMKPYDEELAKQIENLNSSVGAYKTKADKIYDSLATNLQTYANNLIRNISDLSTSVAGITESINSLNV